MLTTFKRIATALRLAPLSTRHAAGLVAGSGLALDEFVAAHAFLVRPGSRVDVEAFLPFLFGSWFTCPVTLDLPGFARLANAPVMDRRALARLAGCLVNAQLAGDPDRARDPSFWAVVIPALRKIGHPYLLVGDSHSAICRINGSALLRPIIPIHLMCTAGSAIGLANPRSRSGYGDRLNALARAIRESGEGSELPTLLQFGQVDIEFVFTYRRIAAKQKRFVRDEYDEFCRKVVASYGRFLDESFDMPGSVRILSVLPPALSDAAWADGYVDGHIEAVEEGFGPDAVRSIEIPSWADRTALHATFNDRLAELCSDRRMTFVDLCRFLLGDRPVVDEALIALSGGRNHHLDIVAAQARLRPLIERTVRDAYRTGGRRVRPARQGSVDRPESATP